jgi:predicted Zn-dependent protease
MKCALGWLAVRPLAAALALLVAGCTAGSDSGAADREIARLSKAERTRIINQYGGVSHDEKLNGWIAALGDTLAGHSGHSDLHFAFAVLDSGEVNAFSTQDGTVFVTRGLLALAANDAEVAATLAHEMGHVIRGDQRRRYQQSQTAGTGGALLGLFSGLAHLSAAPDAGARFSQDQEYGADEVGLRIVNEAGYDPAAMVTLLNALDRDPVLRQSADEASAGLTGVSYIGSHPLTADRVARISALAAKQTPRGRKTGRDTYLQAVDGMTYGGGAAEGYVRGGLFILPRAGIELPLPVELRPHASPGALIATGADGSALILTSARPGTAPTPLAYMTEVWLAGMTLDSYQPTTVGFHPAAVASARVDSDRGPLELGLVAIGWSPSLVYRLVLTAPGGNRAEVDGRLGAVIDGFGPLSESNRLRFPPYRLRIVTVKAGDTVSRIARRMAFDVSRERSFRSLNRLAPNEPLHVGQQVKLVE